MCLVADQGGSDKVAQFKSRVGVQTRSSPIGSAHVIVHRGFGKKMGFQVLLIFILLFKNIISYKQSIEHNNKINTYPQHMILRRNTENYYVLSL